MMLKPTRYLLGLSWLTLAASCACSAYKRVPVWVDSPPTWDDSFRYAVGVCHSSLFEKDREKKAIEDAIDKLATSIETRIESETTVKDAGGKRSGAHRSRASTDISVTDAELLETWRDVDGLRGVRGSLYVLVRMRR